MKTGVLFVLFVSFVLEVYSQYGEYCPSPSSNIGPCTLTCSPGYSCGPDGLGMCCTTACGGSSCIPTLPWWCPPYSPTKTCSVDPCEVKRCPGVPWAACFNDDPCEPCQFHFYVGGRNGLERVPDYLCNSVG